MYKVVSEISRRFFEDKINEAAKSGWVVEHFYANNNRYHALLVKKATNELY